MKNLLSLVLFTLLAAVLVQLTVWAITPVPAVLIATAISALVIFETERKYPFLAPSISSGKDFGQAGRLGNLIVAILLIGVPPAAVAAVAWFYPGFWTPALATVTYVVVLTLLAQAIKLALPS